MTCTFFGHRDVPEEIQSDLEALLIDLIVNDHATMFYAGNHGGFDALVKRTLKKLQQNYPQIHYAVVHRNKWMLERSDTVITYVRYTYGGAAQFKTLAEKKKKGSLIYQ